MSTTTYHVIIQDNHVINHASVLQRKTFARSSVNVARTVSSKSNDFAFFFKHFSTLFYNLSDSSPNRSEPFPRMPL